MVSEKEAKKRVEKGGWSYTPRQGSPSGIGLPALPRWQAFSSPCYDPIVPVPTILPQLVANDGLNALRSAIADPDGWAVEPKVDGVRLLLTFHPDRTLKTRNRRGVRRDWLRGDAFAGGLRRLPNALPILWRGTVLDGELTAGRFQWTMAAILGSKRYRPGHRFVVFDVPFLAGVDLRELPWQDRRDRLELLSRAFAAPYELSPVIEPSVGLALDMAEGRQASLSDAVSAQGNIEGDRQDMAEGPNRPWMSC
jgi:ATP-dependent DNA ligase